MSELSENQRIFLKLVERSLKGQQWASVSNVLWNHAKTMQAEIPELVEIDIDNQRVRPTDEGKVVLKWL